MAEADSAQVLLRKLQLAPFDSDLLLQALTHRSAARLHNERLEFIGDGILNAVVALELYARFPRAREGELTRRRSQLVQEATLAELARAVDLGSHLRLGPGELKAGGCRRDSILADALEAVIAATYLEHGWATARQLIVQLLGDRLDQSIGAPAKDPKTRLQEWLQGQGSALPSYELVDAIGQDHAKTFIALCKLGSLQAEGRGSSRRAAEQKAAAELHSMLQSKTEAK
jgi:ribonuclease-3